MRQVERDAVADLEFFLHACTTGAPAPFCVTFFFPQRFPHPIPYSHTGFKNIRKEKKKSHSVCRLSCSVRRQGKQEVGL